MPWRIEREGTRLRIWIGCPMNDWDLLLDEALRQLEQGNDIGYIEMPRMIPGATPIDAEALGLLRKVLADFSGLEVRTL
jgi:hypothetical protein